MKSLLLLDYNYHPITRHNKTTPKSDLRINRCKLTPRALDHQDQPTSTPTAVRHNRNIMKAAMTIPTTNTRKSTKSTESNINQHHQHPITYTQPPNYITYTRPHHLTSSTYDISAISAVWMVLCDSTVFMIPSLHSPLRSSRRCFQGSQIKQQRQGPWTLGRYSQAKPFFF